MEIVAVDSPRHTLIPLVRPHSFVPYRTSGDDWGGLSTSMASGFALTKTFNMAHVARDGYEWLVYIDIFSFENNIYEHLFTTLWWLHKWGFIF